MDEARRHQLWLLYSILDAVRPNEGYARTVRVLREGFEAEYKDALGYFPDPVTRADADFVHGVFMRLEALRDSMTAHGIVDEDLTWRVTFSGFDFNDPYELSLARYVEYLFDEGRWASHRPAHSMNSHAPRVEWYRLMIDRFGDIEPGRDYRKDPLPESEIRRILAGFDA
jgi:uncharacterized protein YfbU (UPF0304 family)